MSTSRDACKIKRKISPSINFQWTKLLLFYKFEGKKKKTWRASERAWYCIRGLRPRSPSTTTQALPLVPIFSFLPFCPSDSFIVMLEQYEAKYVFRWRRLKGEAVDKAQIWLNEFWCWIFNMRVVWVGLNTKVVIRGKSTR